MGEAEITRYCKGINKENSLKFSNCWVHLVKLLWSYDDLSKHGFYLGRLAQTFITICEHCLWRNHWNWLQNPQNRGKSLPAYRLTFLMISSSSKHTNLHSRTADSKLPCASYRKRRTVTSIDWLKYNFLSHFIFFILFPNLSLHCFPQGHSVSSKEANTIV